MKIEIDLNDILHDDNGDPGETMAESIRRQVIETITKNTAKDIKRQISERVNETIDATLNENLKEVIPVLIDEVLNGTYTPIDAYGRRGEPTTFRTQVINLLQTQMVYKKTNFSSDSNAFTKAVDEAISSNLAKFKAEFAARVDAQYARDAMSFAVAELHKRLGLKS